jgi:hypothetical protein
MLRVLLRLTARHTLYATMPHFVAATAVLYCCLSAQQHSGLYAGTLRTVSIGLLRPIAAHLSP